jgi:hypothetical protein
MKIGARGILLASVAAAVVAFCVVQDRVTAGGAQQYVTLQEAAASGRGPAVTIDQVVPAAVRRGVRQGALSAGVILAVGAVAAVVLHRGSGRP